MKTGTFWKAVAAGALLLAAVYAGILLRDGRPLYDKVQAGGGSIDGVIAFTSDVGNTPRLFLINPGKKTILVYQAAGNTERGVKLIGGRSFALDEDLCGFGSGVEIPYKGDGYTIIEVQRELNTLKKRGGGNH
ncbi:MAG: hypothetical protein JW909_09335 [Planctomycetes bacterium]|nr:hypothetical protein [Planctomycetota bacterium]